jgi:hypothetical protein
MNEGSLKKIKDLFIKPLSKWRPEDMSMKEWLETLFHVRSREINKYKARKPFSMLGLYLAAAAKPIQGVGFRRVKEGMEMFVRTDDMTPNAIYIEINNGHGGKDTVFLLTQEEWNVTKNFLERADV